MIILLFYIFIGWPVKYTVKAQNDQGPNQTIFCQNGRSYRVKADNPRANADDSGPKQTIFGWNMTI